MGTDTPLRGLSQPVEIRGGASVTASAVPPSNKVIGVDGVDYVGLTDDVRAPGIVGTERVYRADTPCQIVRKVGRRR